jgi:hypothetical protein
MASPGARCVGDRARRPIDKWKHDDVNPDIRAGGLLAVTLADRTRRRGPSSDMMRMSTSTVSGDGAANMQDVGVRSPEPEEAGRFAIRGRFVNRGEAGMQAVGARRSSRRKRAWG